MSMNATRRSRPHKLAAALAAAFLILVAGPFPAESIGSPEPLQQFLSRIQQAFSRSDATQICSLLSQREKTIITLPGLYPASGVFGPSQACLIVKQVFSLYSTVSFKIESKDQTSDGTLIQLRCRWDLKSLESSQSLSRTLFLRLRSENTRWVVSEIRSTGADPTRGRE